jgi:hypothetical protein
MAQLMLEYGADINWIVDKVKGYTLLMQLCSIRMELSPQEKYLNSEIIKFLIENGARKDLISIKGKKIKDILEKHCNKEELMKLIEETNQIFFYNKPFEKLIVAQNPNQKIIGSPARGVTPIKSRSGEKLKDGSSFEDEQKKKGGWFGFLRKK